LWTKGSRFRHRVWILGCSSTLQEILEAIIEDIFFQRHLVLVNEAVAVVIKGVIVAKLFTSLKVSEMKCSYSGQL
jgi:hypothetical protein